MEQNKTNKSQTEGGVLEIPGMVIPDIIINIADLPDWANWVTVNLSGEIYAWQEEPSPHTHKKWGIPAHSRAIGRYRRIIDESTPRADWETLKFKVKR